MFKKIASFSNLTLLVALSLSTVAAYYSIIGLTAIFAGAVIPIIIMGSILEIGKITTTVWLRKYWHRASWTIKMYLVPAVVLLAFLTSMGIFGFLSKAHTDQSLVSGDVLAKISVYDEKIKTSQDNIDANRKALKQLDEAVDQVMSRSTSETGADKAVSVRRSQTKERTRLLAEIATEQKTIASLREQRAPIAAEVRKVEAEVGPIKYIAAFIYGDNPDTNLLEAAVRWVIILIVIVFDPLAIALVLAANASRDWDNENEEKPVSTDNIHPIKDEEEYTIKETTSPIKFVDAGEHPKDYDETQIEDNPPIAEKESSILEQNPYLLKGFPHFTNMKPLVYTPESADKRPVIDTEDAIHAYDDERLVTNEDKKILAMGVDVTDRPGDYLTASETIATEGVTIEHPVRELDGEYVLLDGKHMSKSAAQAKRPELFMITADNTAPAKSNFGTKFPEVANKGDIFVRVDVLPNRVYKFDSKRWIEINKENTDTYLHDKEYLKHLVTMISSGQYDVELLSENEKAEIEDYLRSQRG